MKRRSFLNDTRAIVWVMFVGVTTIMISTGTWLIAMLVTSVFVDKFSAQAVGPMTASLGETIRTQGAILVVVIDVGMIVWMVVSAFIKERQEQPVSL